MRDENADVLFQLAMPACEAIAFAQLLKRLGYSDCERLADRRACYGKCAECDVMWSSVQSVQRQFALAGFAPR
jgi:hypothetical protein